MTLRRLVEMIREDRTGANDWPVMFTSYRQLPAGEWQEVDNVREAVTIVEVDIESQEVLLIRGPTRSALTVSSLEEKLSGLMACHGEFTVDTCEPPIVVDGEGNFRIDLPIVGAGRDDSRNCYLVVFAKSVSNSG
jgi:hypothetical protein